MSSSSEDEGLLQHGSSVGKVGTSHSPTSTPVQEDGVVSRGPSEVRPVDTATSATSQSPVGDDNNRWPLAIYYILGNEACERFSFYGMRAILAVYLKDFMNYEEDTATAIFHAFTFTAYAFPLLGGYLADVYWGRFKTILLLSIVYGIGNSCLAITAIPGVTGNPPHWWGILLSLGLISIGTGGIKPNVSSFVGDQFKIGQEALLTSAFGYFYLCINGGSLLSTIITPIMQVKLSFFAAFALPGALIFVATAIFWLGRDSFVKKPPGENMVKTVCGIVYTGIVEKRRAVREGRDGSRPFLSYAVAKYGAERVEEAKAAGRICLFFTPIAVFWSLFDQHSSRWVFQAEQMNLKVLGLDLSASQIPVLNPLFLVSLIPVFDRLIYPALARANLSMKPLTKMKIGTVIAASSFVLAGFLQLTIDNAEPNSISVVFQIPQYLVLSCSEILISITGLEFAYTQAPSSMKSLIAAAWLLSVAFGNLMVVIVAETSFMPRQYMEFWFFAGLMLVAGAFLAFLSWGYVYRSTLGESERTTKVVGVGGGAGGDGLDYGGERQGGGAGGSTELHTSRGPGKRASSVGELAGAALAGARGSGKKRGDMSEDSSEDEAVKHRLNSGARVTSSSVSGVATSHGEAVSGAVGGAGSGSGGGTGPVGGETHVTYGSV